MPCCFFVNGSTLPILFKSFRLVKNKVLRKMSVANFVKLILGYCIMIARELAIPVCSSMTISCSCVQYIYIQLYSPFLVEEKYNTFCILVTDLQWMYVNNLEDYSRSSKLMYNVHISLIRKGCEVFLV